MTEYKINFHNTGLKLSKGDGEYEVRTKGGKEVTVKFKDDVKKGDKSEEIELEYKKKDEEKWKTWKVEAEYEDSTFSRGIKIAKKELESGKELKEEIKPGIGFFKSKKWPFWTIIVVVILAIVGLIWWWIASSRKEDKEEESL